MNSFFEMNKEKLERHCMNLEFLNENIDEKYINETILMGHDDNNSWCLQSQENMDIPIQVWCDQVSDIAHQAVIYVFGLGYYKYIESLVQAHPKDMIVVYEPDEKIMLKQMYQYDLTTIFDQKNIIWIVGEKRRGDLCAVVDERMDYKNGFEKKELVIPNYIKNYPEEYDFYRQQVGMSDVYDRATRTTMIATEKIRGRCYLHNLRDSIEQASINELVKAFQEYDLTDIPVVVISAGPSLHKNIEIIKKYREEVFVICVDTAIRAALQYQIRPDLLVTVDPLKPKIDFENEYGRDIPSIAHVHANWEIIKLHKARRFYSSDKGEFENKLYEQFGKDIGAIVTGGSVSNTAFSVARMLGFTKIIMIGLDLGYPEGKHHAAGLRDDNVDMSLEKNSGRFYVESYDGGEVLTDAPMCIYRNWYEEQVEKNPDITIVDATEGGVLIKGTETIPFEEALQKYCKGKKLDFASIIEGADYLLDSEEQIKAVKWCENVFTEVDDVCKKLKRQIKLYDDLDQLNRKGKYNTNSFKKCIKEISEINDEMDDSNAIYLMRNYANKGEYDVRDEFHKRTENTYEEIAQMVKMGVKLAETYLEAANKLIETRKEILEYK